MRDEQFKNYLIFSPSARMRRLIPTKTHNFGDRL